MFFQEISFYSKIYPHMRVISKALKKFADPGLLTTSPWLPILFGSHTSGFPSFIYLFAFGNWTFKMYNNL